MPKVTNAKLAGEPAWKLWILHQVARLLRVSIKVRGMPYGVTDTSLISAAAHVRELGRVARIND